MNAGLTRRVHGGILAAMLLLDSTAAFAAREGTCLDAQDRFPDTNPGPGSLKSIPVPEPANLSTYIRNRPAAVALGKALFWDMQVGSDGVQSCASCHFRAGADPRSTNQLNPGGQDNPNTTINLGVNHKLVANDYPFHKLSDTTNRQSSVLRDNDDVTSSAGVRLTRFILANRGAESDVTAPSYDPTFNIYGVNTRRNEPRNTPTVFNAAYNPRQFWDVRATNLFNGVSPFGVGDAGARVLKATGLNNIALTTIRIDNAGLASQAVGPPLSDREMGSIGRTFLDVGKRLVSAKPLKKQTVAADDSVLASYRDTPRGLNGTYNDLIQAAFQPQWWQTNLLVRQASNGTFTFVQPHLGPMLPNEYTMAEANFSMFLGLAIQLYEMTLISNDAPIDRHFEGQANALTAQELRGLEIFSGEAACSACHAGPEMTDNSVRILFGALVDGVQQPAEIIERMYNGNCAVNAYDQGVYNLGVRPFEEDFGIGNKDPFNNPLSWTAIKTSPPGQIPSQELLTIPTPNIANPPLQIGERILIKGAFKVPNLRNLELTAPYFHNGGQATIRQVVEFYNRGGDFREHNNDFIDFEIGKLNLTPQEIDDLAAFLGRPLTDERVRQQKAPFDHPQLFVPNGHKVGNLGIPVIENGGVADNLLEVPAVGRNGGPLPAAFLQ